MPYPIVLAHGVSRFDMIWNSSLNIDNNDDPELDKLHYFKGIRAMLRGKGYAVYHSNVAWAASVDRRADDLRKNILNILDRSGSSKVNIIAHSMGGLDARHMMFNDRDSGRIHERIASLTCISTPHAGSPFADWGLEHLPHLLQVADKLKLDVEAFKDLTVAKCRQFNENPDVQQFEAACEATTIFQTYAGRQKFWGIFGVLKLPFYIIEQAEGDNDGLVSVQSAKWKDSYFKGILEKADHLNELGWWDTDQIWEVESAAQLLERVHHFYAGIAEGLP